MTDALILGLTYAVAPTMVAAGALWQGIKGNRKANAIITKTDEIHTLTDGNLTRVLTELADANSRIAALEVILKGRRKAKRATDR